MSDNEILLDRAEQAAAWRRILLVLNAFSYVVWIGVFSIKLAGYEAFPSAAIVAGLLCAVVWLVTLIMLLLGIRDLRRNRALAGLVDDERTQMLRGRAFEAAYWAIMTAVAILLGIAGFMHLDSRLILPTLLAIGVATPGLAFAWMYRT